MKCVSTENLYYRSFLIAWGLFKMALSENTLQSDGFLGGRLVTLSLFFGSFKQGHTEVTLGPLSGLLWVCPTLFCEQARQEEVSAFYKEGSSKPQRPSPRSVPFSHSASSIYPRRTGQTFPLCPCKLSPTTADASVTTDPELGPWESPQIFVFQPLPLFFVIVHFCEPSTWGFFKAFCPNVLGFLTSFSCLLKKMVFGQVKYQTLNLMPLIPL